MKPQQLPVLVFLLLTQLISYAQPTLLPQQKDRWQIQPNGSIAWHVKDNLPHSDHIEMSGEKVSVWVSYGINSAGLSNILRKIVFPTFRILPDDTFSHIGYTFQDNELPRFYINHQIMDIALPVKTINQQGIMRITATTGNAGAIQVERSIFPSVDKPMVIEKFTFTNSSNAAVTVAMEKMKREATTDPLISKVAAHTVIMQTVNAGSNV